MCFPDGQINLYLEYDDRYFLQRNCVLVSWDPKQVLSTGVSRSQPKLLCDGGEPLLTFHPACSSWLAVTWALVQQDGVVRVVPPIRVQQSFGAGFQACGFFKSVVDRWDLKARGCCFPECWGLLAHLCWVEDISRCLPGSAVASLPGVCVCQWHCAPAVSSVNCQPDLLWRAVVLNLVLLHQEWGTDTESG